MNSLIKYTLQLADSALILGHRNSEWTGHGPILEQDIAISNIALDLIGQARNFYQYAAQLLNSSSPQLLNSSTEDTLAFHRDVIDYKNVLLAEQPNGDWAKTILRQFFFSGYQYYLYQQLQHSTDPQLAAIAEKSLKEVTYHLKWSSEWVIRLGDGTDESHLRMKNALKELWQFTGELRTASQYESDLFAEKISPDYNLIKSNWDQKINEVLTEANLSPYLNTELKDTWMQSGGKEGKHTEQLGFLLAEMQFLQRAYPGAEW
ncbi:MAG TPA: 1,2-phenylacetyl-CoA epoxidase subunit PaaC [Chitinophagaceae bacterium]|nr:1,2-phenylacetyl-CoA epoxidase subunit PaaC [Chitinophagaceae bacterium]